MPVQLESVQPAMRTEWQSTLTPISLPSHCPFRVCLLQVFLVKVDSRSGSGIRVLWHAVESRARNIFMILRPARARGLLSQLREKELLGGVTGLKSDPFQFKNPTHTHTRMYKDTQRRRDLYTRMNTVDACNIHTYMNRCWD